MATNLSIDTISDIHTYGVDVERREIYLHGYVTNTEEDPGVEYRMATNFYKNIRMLDAISNNPSFFIVSIRYFKFSKSFSVE